MAVQIYEVLPVILIPKIFFSRFIGILKGSSCIGGVKDLRWIGGVKDLRWLELWKFFPIGFGGDVALMTGFEGKKFWGWIGILKK